MDYHNQVRSVDHNRYYYVPRGTGREEQMQHTRFGFLAHVKKEGRSGQVNPRNMIADPAERPVQAYLHLAFDVQGLSVQ